MKDDFFKFPSTPHLALPDGVEVRDDKVMPESERDDFLQHELVIEEKVDGANLGISFDAEGKVRAQNRGGYLFPPMTGQWKTLTGWLSSRTDIFFEQLTHRYILFGEWCYARHSVVYDRLPDWFLGFDIYDKSTAKFFSCSRRDEAFQAMDISQVPTLKRGHFTLPEINRLLSKSQLGNAPAEGLYLRVNHDDWLKQRAKLMHPDFIQSIEQHWSRSEIKVNWLRPVGSV